MDDEELEELFSYINGVEDRMQQIDNAYLYEYVVNRITANEWCSLEDYKDFLGESDTKEEI